MNNHDFHVPFLRHCRRHPQASTDADNSEPTSQGKSTAHNTKHKTLLPDTEQEGKKLMSDQHNVPKAKSLDEMGSNES